MLILFNLPSPSGEKQSHLVGVCTGGLTKRLTRNERGIFGVRRKEYTEHKLGWRNLQWVYKMVVVSMVRKIEIEMRLSWVWSIYWRREYSCGTLPTQCLKTNWLSVVLYLPFLIPFLPQRQPVIINRLAIATARACNKCRWAGHHTYTLYIHRHDIPRRLVQWHSYNAMHRHGRSKKKNHISESIFCACSLVQPQGANPVLKNIIKMIVNDPCKMCGRVVYVISWLVVTLRWYLMGSDWR